MLRGGGAGIAKGIGTRCRQRKIQFVQQLQGKRMIRHAQSNRGVAACNQIRNHGFFLQNEGYRAWTNFFSKEHGLIRNFFRVRVKLSYASHMHNKRVKSRAIFGFKDFYNGIGIQRVGCKAINGFCGYGHKLIAA